MNRSTQRFLGLGILAISLFAGKTSAADANTWTGWFSDLECASVRAANGTYSATNPDCARRCIEKGVAPAFINEQNKTVYKVVDYGGAKEDLGYHVEVTGKIDDKAKTITIQRVNHLEFQGASCALPKKKAN